jgi:dehydrogenase/reductase SDR family protein 12
LRDRIGDIHECGAELVIVGSGSQPFARAFVEDLQLDCPVLVDPELSAYRAAGLRRGKVELISPRLPFHAIRALRSGSVQSNVQGDAWQLGGVFVIRPDGELLYRHASREAGDHAPVGEILSSLEENVEPIRESSEVLRAQAFVGEVLSRVVDPFIISSFDRTGFRIHSLTFQRDDLAVDLSGKRCLVTGANSGIGFETSRALADLGAEVMLLCRSRERGEQAARTIREQTGNPRVFAEVVDMSSLGSIREAGARLSSGPVDVLVHNAGVLPYERIETGDGLESTFATHVVGPFLLTRQLRERLEESDDGRVIFVSSGGMYTRRLNLEDLDWAEREYDGVTAYAETKRAQVVLAELWSEELAGSSVVVNSMHPGWADTPAVKTSLPWFHRVMQKVLRTPAEGADTVVWLAACPRANQWTGRFFFDRSERRTHLLPFTRESERDRRALWRICEIASSATSAGIS